MSLTVEQTSRPIDEFLASPRTLAVLDFEAAEALDPRHVPTGLRALPGSPVLEVWRSPTLVSWGSDGAVRWASSEHVLFMATVADASPSADLAEETRCAWRRLLRYAEERGYRHLLRAWNHVPRINDGAGDAERYKQFCAGRARGFDAEGYEPHRFSAASAVGSDGDALVVYALAAKEPGRHHENPRQVSAYAYPREYGPRPPSFARATSKHWPDAMHVFVSGTASIVGHRSACPGDVDGQLAVTLDNLRRLLAQVDGANGRVPDALRVYVRNPAQLAQIQRGVGRFAPNASVVYLRADICRAELLLEIEGVLNA